MRALTMALLLFSLISTAALSAEPKYKLGDIPSPEENGRRDKQPIDKTSMAPENKTELANQIADDFYLKGVTAMKEGNLEQAEGYFDRVLILKPHHKGAQDGIDAIMKAYESQQESTNATDKRAQLIKKLVEDMNARFNSGDLEGADEVVDEILAVDPRHKKARHMQNLIHQAFFDDAISRADEREKSGDLEGAVDSLQVALGYRKDPSLRQRIKDLQTALVQQNNEKSDKLYVEALAANQNGKTDAAVTLCRQALSLNPANHQAQRMLQRLSPKIPTVTK